MTSRTSPGATAPVPAGRLPRLLGARRAGLLAGLVLNGLAQAALGLAAAFAVGLATGALTDVAAPEAGAPAGASPATPVSPPEGLGWLPALPEPTGSVAVLAAAALAAAAALGVAALRAREVVTAERTGQSYVHDARMALLDQVLAGDLRDSQRRSTGGVALRFVGDLQALHLWVSRGVARLCVAVPVLLVSLAVLTWWSPALGAAVSGLSAGALALLLARSAPLRASTRRARSRRSRVAADVTERVGQLSTVVANGAEDRERGRVERRSRALREAMVDRAGDVGWLRGVAEAGAGLGAAVLLATAVVSGAGVAEVVAAMTLVGFLTTPVRDLGRVTEYAAGAVVARRKVLDVLARPRRLDPDPGARLPRGRGRLELVDVRVAGPGAGSRVLDGVDLTVEPGEVVAVTGGNGAGKSTLLAVAAGLATPAGGRVLLDGVDLADLTPRRRRRAVGVAGPDVPLLRGTVARNVTYRRPDADRDRIAAALRASGLDAVLDTLPQRERTRVGERGSGLSAGQRARVELARALLGPPRLLLLDEADAALDAAGRAALARLVADFRGAVLLVTHRPELAAAADRVVSLRDGRLAPVPPAVTEVAS